MKDPHDPHPYVVPHCRTCGRPVTFYFRMIGLATTSYELVHRAAGPSLEPVTRHAYPCVGKPTNFRELLAEFVRIVNDAEDREQI